MMIPSDVINTYATKSFIFLNLLVFCTSVLAIKPSPYEAVFRVSLDYKGHVEITPDVEDRLLGLSSSPTEADLEFSQQWTAVVGSAELSVLNASFGSIKDYLLIKHSNVAASLRPSVRTDQAEKITDIQTLRTALCQESYRVNDTLSDTFSILVFFCVLQKL